MPCSQVPAGPPAASISPVRAAMLGRRRWQDRLDRAGHVHDHPFAQASHRLSFSRFAARFAALITGSQKTCRTGWSSRLHGLGLICACRTVVPLSERSLSWARRGIRPLPQSPDHRTAALAAGRSAAPSSEPKPGDLGHTACRPSSAVASLHRRPRPSWGGRGPLVPDTWGPTARCQPGAAARTRHRRGRHGARA